MCSRKRSPVERWTQPFWVTSAFAWVPLPTPGGPRKTRSPTPLLSSGISPDEALVGPLQELGLELLHRLDHDADDDEDARAAEPEGLHLRDVADERRHDRHDPQEERARDRDARHDARKELGGRAARTDAGDEPAVSLDVVSNVVRDERERRVEAGEGDH